MGRLNAILLQGSSTSIPTSLLYTCLYIYFSFSVVCKSIATAISRYIWEKYSHELISFMMEKRRPSPRMPNPDPSPTYKNLLPRYQAAHKASNKFRDYVTTATCLVKHESAQKNDTGRSLGNNLSPASLMSKYL